MLKLDRSTMGATKMETRGAIAVGERTVHPEMSESHGDRLKITARSDVKSSEKGGRSERWR